MKNIRMTHIVRYESEKWGNPEIDCVMAEGEHYFRTAYVCKTLGVETNGQRPQALKAHTHNENKKKTNMT